MTIGKIKRIIEEMKADLVLSQSLYEGKYEFYKEERPSEAYEELQGFYRIYKKINILNMINTDKITEKILKEITDLLGDKEDYFSEKEIDTFISACRPLW